MKSLILRAALALAVVAPAGIAQAQDADAGKKIFNQCRACHEAERERNKVGPHLVGLIGRPVASIDGFRYSDAMKSWGEGKVWDEETFLTYIEKPQEIVEGTKMAYRGVKKEDDRANLLAYLKSAGS